MNYLLRLANVVIHIEPPYLALPLPCVRLSVMAANFLDFYFVQITTPCVYRLPSQFWAGCWRKMVSWRHYPRGWGNPLFLDWCSRSRGKKTQGASFLLPPSKLVLLVLTAEHYWCCAMQYVPYARAVIHPEEVGKVQGALRTHFFFYLGEELFLLKPPTTKSNGVFFNGNQTSRRQNQRYLFGRKPANMVFFPREPVMTVCLVREAATAWIFFHGNFDFVTEAPSQTGILYCCTCGTRHGDHGRRHGVYRWCHCVVFVCLWQDVSLHVSKKKEK